MPACQICELHAESTFKIEGMDCHEEVAILEKRLKTLTGLEALDADILGQRLKIKYDAAKLSTGAIAEAVAQTGMRAWLEHEQPVGQAPSAATRRLFVVLSGVLTGAGMALEFAAVDRRLTIAIFALAIASGGIYVARRAFHAARSLALDINVLMLVAVAGAMVLGQWSEGAAVVFLFALAQLLEARAMERARASIRALMDLTPADALVRDASHPDGTRRVAVDDIRIGDVVVVRPGEKIPLDGCVAAGVSHVNQAPVTGESLPVEKSAGDEVFAGTINGRGGLDVRVERIRADSTLARIIDLVERAQAQRAPARGGGAFAGGVRQCAETGEWRVASGEWLLLPLFAIGRSPFAILPQRSSPSSSPSRRSRLSSPARSSRTRGWRPALGASRRSCAAWCARTSRSTTRPRRWPTTCASSCASGWWRATPMPRSWLSWRPATAPSSCCDRA